MFLFFACMDVGFLDRCLSGIDDSRHVRRVLTLWKEKYSAPGPFVIPQPPSASFEFNGGRSSADRAAAVTAAKPPPRHDASAIPLAHLPIPKTELNTPRTAYAAPSTVTPSHASDVAKLRHPSRLHSRDLTDNTFRIYLRHYMDRIAETASNDTNEMPPLAGGSRPVIPTSPTPVRSAAGLSSRLPGGTVPGAEHRLACTACH